MRIDVGASSVPLWHRRSIRSLSLTFICSSSLEPYLCFVILHEELLNHLISCSLVVVFELTHSLRWLWSSLYNDNARCERMCHGTLVQWGCAETKLLCFFFFYILLDLLYSKWWSLFCFPSLPPPPPVRAIWLMVMTGRRNVASLYWYASWNHRNGPIQP